MPQRKLRRGFYATAGPRAATARTMAGAMRKGAQMRGARGAGQGAASRQSIRFGSAPKRKVARRAR